MVSDSYGKFTIGVFVSNLKGGSEFVANTRVFIMLSKSNKSYIASGMNDELYSGQLRAAAYIEEHFGVEE